MVPALRIELPGRIEPAVAFRALAERSRALFRSRRQTVTAFASDGDTATAEVAYEAVLAVDLPGGPRAGEPLRLAGRSEFVFRDGALYGITDYS